jgi:WD40 repeat protein
MIRTHIHPTRALLAALLLAAPAAAQPPTPRADRQGDPLPRGALLRLGTVRLRHGDGVRWVTYSPDGRLLASLGRDRALRIWEAATGRPVLKLQEPDCEYHTAVFSPDGGALVVAAGDPLRGGNTALRYYDTATGRERRRLEGHRLPAYTLGFAADGESLLSVGGEQVILWDAIAGQPRAQWKQRRGGAAVAVAPDCRTLAGVGSDSDEKTIYLWDAATGKERRRLRGHERGVVALAFSPDGRLLASGNPFEAIRTWDAGTGKVVLSLPEKHGAMALAFAPDGRLLASACLSGTVRLWDAGTGKLVRSLRGYQGWVNGLTFSPDGKVLAVAGADSQTVRLWEVATGKDLRPRCGHRGDVHALAYAPDGRTLASGGGDRQDGDTAIRVWDAASGRELRRLEGHAARVHCLAYAPDGRTLASGGEREDEVRLWDVDSGACVRRLRRSPASGEGTWLAWAGVGGRRSPTPEEAFGGDRRVSAVGFSPDGRTLAAGLDDGALVLWDAESGEERRRLPGHEGRVTALAFSPEGKRLLTGSLDRTARLWDLTTGKELRRLGAREDAVVAVAFSADGRLAAVGGCDWEGVGLWEADTGREVGRLGCGLARPSQLAFAPDGRTLAAGCAGRGLRLWEVATRRLRRELPGHAAGVRALAFSPDGARLATGSPDSTVLVWDVAGPDCGRAEALTAARLEALWADLGGEDAARADRAIRAMLAAPAEAVPFLKARLRPARALSSERQAEMLRDLDHPRYQVRNRATTELARQAELAEPLLRRTLAAPASPEVRRRVEMLLEGLAAGTPAPANLRALRAFEVLERIGTAEVRPLLEAHAEAALAARLAQEARASLERLTRRAALPNWGEWLTGTTGPRR